ncbi:MAG: YihY/virulence factor BrkB family protein [Bacteroidota bacterium]
MENIKKQGFLKRIFSFVQELFTEFGQDNAVTLAAALSYYTVFSIAPLLVIVLAVTSFFLGAEAVQGQLYEQLGGLLGKETAIQLQEVVKNAYVSGQSVFATIISVGALLFSATAVVGQLKSAINTAWNIKEDPQKSGVLAYIKNRLLSLTFILGLGFIFLVSLGLNSVAAFFSDEIIKLFPFLDRGLTVVMPLVVSGVITLTLFSLLFKYLPDAIIKWKDVFAGAVFTTILFIAGKYLIGFYIGNSNATSTFGGAGALASMMLWVYYSAMILILGAEFIQVWARRRETRILPNKNSIKYVYEKAKVS